jgi:hypothetical protein
MHNVPRHGRVIDRQPSGNVVLPMGRKTRIRNRWGRFAATTDIATGGAECVSATTTTTTATTTAKADVAVEIAHRLHDTFRHSCPSFLLRWVSDTLTALLSAGFSCPAAQSGGGS